MAKVAVVFWSGSGNTEAMANAVMDGVTKGGAEGELIRVGDFSADRIADYDGILMGCPACGTEELDEGEFEPFFVEAGAAAHSWRRGHSARRMQGQRWLQTV